MVEYEYGYWQDVFKQAKQKVIPKVLFEDAKVDETAQFWKQVRTNSSSCII